jgi:NDP-sugar pyrophosphorylase family protein
MDLIIFSNGETSQLDMHNKDITEFIAKIEVELLFSRIIRIAKENNIQKVFCILDKTEIFLNEYISTHDFDIAVKVIIRTKQCPLHELFALSSSLKTNPFCLVTLYSLFSADDFSMFIDYSLSQEDIEGVVSITHLKDEKAPLCVALNEEDGIIKFNNTTEGYNWVAKDICFFYPHFFNEMRGAIDTGISELRDYLPLLINKGYQLNGFIFSSIIEINNFGFPNISDFFHNSDTVNN